LTSILVLEKLVDKDIYSFGIFQTLIGTLLYAQLGLPQNFIKQNIKELNSSIITRNFETYLGTQIGLSLILLPFFLFVGFYLSESVIYAILISLNVFLISLINIFGAYFRVVNSINLWILSVGSYTVVAVIYLLLPNEPNLLNLLILISVFNIVISLLFFTRTKVRIRVANFSKIVYSSIAQLIMNFGAPFLIIINRYFALNQDYENFRIYQEIFTVFSAAGLIVNSIAQLLSAKILKSIGNNNNSLQEWIANNLLTTTFLMTSVAYALSYLVVFKYSLIFQNNIGLYLVFLTPTLLIINHNYFIAKNKEIYTIIPLAVSLSVYIIPDLKTYSYLISSMVVYVIVYYIVFFNILVDANWSTYTISVRNLAVITSLILLLSFVEIYSFIVLILLLLIYRTRAKAFFYDLIKFYNDKDSFLI
jgi:hypothetical protein